MMFACILILRRIAQWLLAIHVPDPDLQYELMGWAMGLLLLSQGMADAVERWRGA